MFHFSRPAFLIIICNVTFLFSCNTSRHNEKEVEVAMQHYDRLIQKMDVDSIAMLFTTDGDLGTIAHGRDSIRNFLSSFKNVQVLSQSSITDSIKIKGNTSFQKGMYHQTDVPGGKDTVSVKGEYTAYWEWIPKTGWHIKHIETKPYK